MLYKWAQLCCSQSLNDELLLGVIRETVRLENVTVEEWLQVGYVYLPGLSNKSQTKLIRNRNKQEKLKSKAQIQTKSKKQNQKCRYYEETRKNSLIDWQSDE